MNESKDSQDAVFDPGGKGRWVEVESGNASFDGTRSEGVVTGENLKGFPACCLSIGSGREDRVAALEGKGRRSGQGEGQMGEKQEADMPRKVFFGRMLENGFREGEARHFVG